MLEASLAYDAMNKNRHIIADALGEFEAKLREIGLSPDVRFGTIAILLQDLSFAAVAGIGCCEDDYRKRFLSLAEELRRKAIKLAHDTEYYTKIARAKGDEPRTSCVPVTDKPTIN